VRDDTVIDDVEVHSGRKKTKTDISDRGLYLKGRTDHNNVYNESEVRYATYPSYPRVPSSTTAIFITHQRSGKAFVRAQGEPECSGGNGSMFRSVELGEDHVGPRARGQAKDSWKVTLFAPTFLS